MNNDSSSRAAADGWRRCGGGDAMRTWAPKVYDLSRERVAELQRFCWQYREKRTRIAAMRKASGGGGVGRPRGKGGIGRPTESAAIRIVDGKDARDVRMIEEAAWEASGGSKALYECLIANVCDRVAFQSLKVPQGINQFTQTRRRFFWLLDRKR